MNSAHLERLAQQQGAEAWQCKPLTHRGQTMHQQTNVQIMEEIRQRDNLSPIIYLAGAVALVREAREECNAWRQRAQQAEAELARAAQAPSAGVRV